MEQIVKTVKKNREAKKDKNPRKVLNKEFQITVKRHKKQDYNNIINKLKMEPDEKKQGSTLTDHQFNACLKLQWCWMNNTYNNPHKLQLLQQPHSHMVVTGVLGNLLTIRTM